MEPKQIEPGCSYRGCNGIAYAVEEVRDGLVRFRTNGRGTPVSIDCDTFAGLMKHEITNKETPDD